MYTPSEIDRKWSEEIEADFAKWRENQEWSMKEVPKYETWASDKPRPWDSRGTPVFTGTRVPVKKFIDHLKAGESLDYFLQGFPSVSREQAIAFLEFALTETIRLHLR